MKGSWIKCDWCEKEITTHYVQFATRHIGAFATWEGARYDFDFCDEACLDAWRAHARHPRRYVERMATAFADMSDEELAASNRMGTSVELRRRQVGLVERRDDTSEGNRRAD